MKVKNGIASSVSLPMTPRTRSGIAWNSATGKTPSLMPTMPQSRPVNASENATG